MRVLSPSAIREVERRTIEEAGIPGQILMENAGMRVADAVVAAAGACGTPRVLVVCGRGNNGGDGLVAARLLAASSHSVRVALLHGPGEMASEESKTNLAFLRAFDVPVQECALPDLAGGADIIVDAMLGTGASGPPRPPYDGWIAALNASPATIVAVDVPSGLDCGSGAGVDAVRADYTVSFIAAKPGFFVGDGPDRCGTIQVEDISIPTAFFADA